MRRWRQGAAELRPFAGVRAILVRFPRQSDTLRSVTTLRLTFVGLLVVLQSFDLSSSFEWLTRTPLWIMPGVAMNGLLALAGFAIARSADREGPGKVLRQAAWQFVPALILVIVLTALVAGPVITVQRRTVYFSDPQVWTYLLNLLGYSQTVLPGVFLDNNVVGTVNDATWVIPVGYLAILLILLAARRGGYASLALVGAAFLAVSIGALLQSDLVSSRLSVFLSGLAGGRGLNGLVAFLAGALAYRERAKLIVDARIAAVLLVGGILLGIFGDRSVLESPLAGPAVSIVIAYLSLVLGSARLPLRHAGRAEPLLWPVFLVAYPVQQFWIAEGPFPQGAALNLLLSIPVIVFFTAIFWFGLQVPVMRRFAPDVLMDHPKGPIQVPALHGSLVFNPIAVLRAALPQIVAALFIVLTTLGLIAMAVFAMQRDPGGV